MYNVSSANFHSTGDINSNDPTPLDYIMDYQLWHFEYCITSSDCGGGIYNLAYYQNQLSDIFCLEFYNSSYQVEELNYYLDNVENIVSSLIPSFKHFGHVEMSWLANTTHDGNVFTHYWNGKVLYGNLGQIGE